MTPDLSYDQGRSRRRNGEDMRWKLIHIYITFITTELAYSWDERISTWTLGVLDVDG